MNLIFNNVALETVKQDDGQVWITSKSLANALGYADDRSVSKLYEANSDEFTDKMTAVVETTTVKNAPYKQRIFSLRGCHLIAMFSRTYISKEFRKWVLDVLDKETNKIQIQEPVKHEPTAQEKFNDAIESLLEKTANAINCAVSMKGLNDDFNLKVAIDGLKIIKEIDSGLINKHKKSLHRPVA